MDPQLAACTAGQRERADVECGLCKCDWDDWGLRGRGVSANSGNTCGITK